MPEEDDAPRRKASHVVGERLDDLSIHDFEERIRLLHAEIERLEAAMLLKKAALDRAGSVFKL